MARSRPRIFVPREVESIYERLDREYLEIQLVHIDLQRKVDGISAFFPLDYYEIHTYIHPGLAQRAEVRLVQYYIENLEYPFLILPPTVWEFLRHMKNVSDDLRTHLDVSAIDSFLASPRVHSFYRSIEDGAQPAEILKAYYRMGQFRIIVDFIKEDAVQALIRRPIESLLGLISVGKLRSLEEITEDTALKYDEDVYSRLLRKLDARRPDKKVNNRIDAMCLAMTHELNERHYNSASPSYYAFVTHSPLVALECSRIRWKKDPLAPRRSSGLQFSRSHRYCAARARLEQECEDPIAVTGEHLENILQVKGSFHNRVVELNHRFGDELVNMPAEQIATHFAEENLRLAYLLESLARACGRVLIRSDALDDMVDDQRSGTPDREQIREALQASDAALTEKAREVWQTMWKMLDGFDPGLIDPEWFDILVWLE